MEAAVEARSGGRDDPGIRADQETLSAELAAAQEENARLRETNDDIAARLDTAIARLKSVLEG